MRLASDTGTGLPEPITLQKRQASAKNWSSFGPAQIEVVMQGTGCYDDKEAVQRALQDAKGNADEVCHLRLPTDTLSRSACWNHHSWLLMHR